MKTDREKHSLRGPVKTVQVETAQLEGRDGRHVEVPWFGHAITFNPAGQIVEQINRNADGSEWRTVNDYDDSGRLLATTHYEPSGGLSGGVRYQYDEMGRCVSEQYVTAEGKGAARVTYDYDKEGRKIKTEELDPQAGANLLIGIEGTNSSISAQGARQIETRYNEQGDATEVRVFNAGGELAGRTEITRDEQGNPLEETQYVGETFPFEPCLAEACVTEEGAELTEEQRQELEAELAGLLSPGAHLARHVHSYDEEGRLVESKLTMMGMEAGRQTFAYDEFGNLAEEVSYGEGGEFQSRAIFTREYDDRGNWTRELVSSASSRDAEPGDYTPVHVTRRTITYY